MTKTYTDILTTEDVTEEILEAVRQIESGWYADKRIDWEDVWERVERTPLEDGSFPDFGPEVGSLAMRHIKKIINRERREG